MLMIILVEAVIKENSARQCYKADIDTDNISKFRGKIVAKRQKVIGHVGT